MAPRRPAEPHRIIGDDVDLMSVAGTILDRLSRQYGGDPLLYARDLHAAIDAWVGRAILLDIVQGKTWKQIGDRLGVSAQAAHRKYRPR
jgi:hypothetical protein